MKIFLLSLLLMFTVAFGYSQSPIIIDKNDMPNPGDTLRVSNASRQYSIDFTQTGANFTWDYHDLKSTSQFVDTFLNPINTAPGYYLTFQDMIFDPNHFATIAAPNYSFPAAIPLVNITFSESFDFFKATDNYYAKIGQGIKVNGLPTTTKFNPVDKIYQFPLQFGNIDSSQSNYEVNVPTLYDDKNSTNRIDSVDGWGTLITPYGT